MFDGCCRRSRLATIPRVSGHSPSTRRTSTPWRAWSMAAATPSCRMYSQVPTRTASSSCIAAAWCMNATRRASRPRQPSRCTHVVSKSMVGNLMRILVDRGVVELDRSAGHYVPELLAGGYGPASVASLLTTCKAASGTPRTTRIPRPSSTSSTGLRAAPAPQPRGHYRYAPIPRRARGGSHGLRGIPLPQHGHRRARLDRGAGNGSPACEVSCRNAGVLFGCGGHAESADRPGGRSAGRRRALRHVARPGALWADAARGRFCWGPRRRAGGVGRRHPRRGSRNLRAFGPCVSLPQWGLLASMVGDRSRRGAPSRALAFMAR